MSSGECKKKKRYQDCPYPYNLIKKVIKPAPHAKHLPKTQNNTKGIVQQNHFTALVKKTETSKLTVKKKQCHQTMILMIIIKNV